MKWLMPFLLSLACFAQQAQTHDVSNPEPIYGANAKWTQGVGPGFWPTAGSGLTLNLKPGTAFCSGAIDTYAGGTLTMTNSTTNYVYLNTSASCAPAVKTTTFTSSDIPIAVVVAAGGVITTITDDRNMFFTGGTSVGQVSTKTTNYTLTSSDSGNLIVMNCSSACTVTMYGSPSNGFFGAIESIGSTTATVSLNSLNFNGASSVPALIADQAMLFWSDGSNYFGSAPPKAGTGITLSAASNGLTIIASGTGTVTTTGSPSSGNMTKFSGATSITNGDLSGDVTTSGTLAATIAANVVTSAKLAVVNTRRTCMMIIGADNATAALSNSDLGPQLNQCFIPFAATVVEVEVMADAGTPNVIVQRSHLGTPTALLSGALATASAGAVACSNTGGTTGLDGTTTCSSTLQNTSVAVGDWIGLTSGTAGGTAKRMTVAVTMTVN
jgi:hypothetical protein